jgi:hypothetical protein
MQRRWRVRPFTQTPDLQPLLLEELCKLLQPLLRPWERRAFLWYRLQMNNAAEPAVRLGRRAKNWEVNVDGNHNDSILHTQLGAGCIEATEVGNQPSCGCCSVADHLGSQGGAAGRSRRNDACTAAGQHPWRCAGVSRTKGTNPFRMAATSWCRIGRTAACDAAETARSRRDPPSACPSAPYVRNLRSYPGRACSRHASRRRRFEGALVNLGGTRSNTSFDTETQRIKVVGPAHV